MRTARNKGRAEGIHETNRENALKMKKLGVSAAIISQVTGLTVEEIQAL
jgi:predicted transposase/invertase (TIGR01784 family)